MVMTLLTRPKKTIATVIVATDGSGHTTDIQTGVDLLPAEGGAVYIREGTYRINTPIEVNKHRVVLRGSGYSTIIELEAPATRMFNVAAKVGTGFYNLTLDTNDLGDGIVGTGCLGIIMSELYMYGTNGTDFCISLVTCEQAQIIKSNVNGVELDNCEICVVTQNKINHVDNNLYIHNDSNYNNITHNTFKTGKNGIRITDNSDNNIVAGNQSRDHTDGGNGRGIWIDGATCNKNIVTGNISLINDINYTDTGTNTEIGHNITT